jgi:chromosome segregation ATPase
MSTHHLYAVDPADFVAERDRLAKELRAAGEKDEAAAVKKLRRPAVPVWALNQVARSDAKALDGFVAATNAARNALESGERDAVREALAERRQAMRDVVRSARRVIDESGRSGATQEREVESALLAVTESPEALDALQRGELAEVPAEAASGDEDVSAMFAVVPEHVTAKKRDDRRLERARDDVERLSTELEQAENELADAEMAVADANRELEEAKERVADAQKAAAAARKERGRAEQALQRARAALDKLE